MKYLLDKIRNLKPSLLLAFGALIPLAVMASENGGGHSNEFSVNFLIILGIILAALVGRWMARKTRQPEVLGELIIGIVLGTVLYEAGMPLAHIIRHHTEINQLVQGLDPSQPFLQHAEQMLMEMDMEASEQRLIEGLITRGQFVDTYLAANYALLFSSLGVVLLLFMVGLETNINEMLTLGKDAIILAITGIVLPFVFGYFTIHWFYADGSNDLAIFMGATLGATSIGITARVFADAKAIQLREAHMVLGAAVLDDILGLVLLAVVSGLVVTGSFDPLSMGWILLKAILFLGFIYWLDKKFMHRLVYWFSKLAKNNTFTYFPFALLMLMAWVTDAIGLATIVGAFCAGLVLKDYLFDNYRTKGQSIHALHRPLEEIFAPVFFVLMGFQVDIGTFTEMSVLKMGLLLSLMAIVGKVIAAAFLYKKYNWLLVGTGLVPRGEVGLIFASIGKSIGVLSASMFSIVIIVVVITTLITPPVLALLIKQHKKKEEAATESA